MQQLLRCNGRWSVPPGCGACRQPFPTESTRSTRVDTGESTRVEPRCQDRLPRMVTRDDVARRAGTSPAVVSYVLNNGPRPVAAATRARVEAAVAELGYRPNLVAKALRSARSNTIGLVVPDSTESFFTELVHAVERAAHAEG